MERASNITKNSLNMSPAKMHGLQAEKKYITGGLPTSNRDIKVSIPDYLTGNYKKYKRDQVLLTYKKIKTPKQYQSTKIY